MKDTHKPTATPWTQDGCFIDGPASGFGELRIATTAGNARYENEANAAHIVKAVNALPVLVAALEQIAAQNYEPEKIMGGESWSLAASNLALAALLLVGAKTLTKSTELA
jgi:hypothetical protein